jgi:hypothetical protein
MFNNVSAEKITLIVLAVAGAICGPLLIYVIFLAVLNGAYTSQFKKMTASFRAFQDALDNSVMLFREEQDEFVSENIEEINATIEEILANKLDNKELIEIVTTPKIDESFEIPKVEAPVAPIPAPPETKPAPVVTSTEVAASDIKNEDVRKGERLVQLVYIASKASKDPNITNDQLVELAELIYQAKNSNDYTSPDEQSIFDDCLEVLSSAYYG